MISISLKGRLGNQIFQYTICRLVAHINSYNFYIPEVGEPSTEGIHVKNFFDNLDLGINDGQIRHFIYDDIYSQSFNPNVFTTPDFTKLDGFFQSPKYFDGYEDIIRSWFNLTLNDESKNILEKYDVNNFCYIHLRGSDYKWTNHWFLNKDYYQKGMDYIKTIYPNMKFLIITDDTNDSKNLFPDIDCISSNDMKTDFLVLLNSKFNIISNSTFSWWSAWIKKKEIVIAPNNWLNYNKPELGFYPVDIKTNEFIYL
jgi:hypothetical protein